MSLLLTIKVINIENNEIIDNLIYDLENPDYKNYTLQYIDNLLVLCNGYNGYLSSSYAHEILNKYILWLQKQENNIFRKIKNNLNSCIINIYKKINNNTNININMNINMNNDLIISSTELINKLSLVRKNLRMFDETDKNNIEIKRFLTCKILNITLSMNNFFINNSVVNRKLSDNYLSASNILIDSCISFDDELEPVFLD